MEIDPREEARAALSDLLDRLAFLTLTFGLLTTAIGLVRVTSRGWHANVITDLAFFGSIVIVVLVRRRLPVVVVLSLLLAIVAAMSLAGFINMGLATVSFVGLTACCMVAGVVFGVRLGFILLGLNVVLVSLIGAAVCGGHLTGIQVTDPYFFEPQTWVAQIAGFAGFTAVTLVVSGALQSRLSNTLLVVSRHAADLRESEERYRLLADNMRDVLFLQNMEFGIDYVSPSAERLFGYTVGEILQIDAMDLFKPECRERAGESFQHALAMADGAEFEVPPQEFEYLRKDGSTFWGEMTPVFIRDSGGRIVGVQGILRDISVRKQIELEREELERELRQSEKLKAIGQLAGGIAHDFNNQLVPIMAHADLMARGMVDLESVADHARKIITPARNAADLTGKLLAFARRGSYEYRAIDMHEIITEVVEILAHGIDRRITVKRHFEAVSAVVEGDRTQLQNVLLNLGLNSRDAIPTSGEIVFKTTILDSDAPGEPLQLVISVEDTGEGMEDEVLERVFEPFFTTKVLGKGTGMGLAVAYGTVASHGGRIEIASRVGQGTLVSMVLPLSAASTGTGVAGHAENVVAGLGRVLLVDDEEGVRSALTDLLQSLGYSVVAFGRALEAVAHFKENWAGFDLLVLDLVLPDMSGRETLAVMREVNPDVKVLLVSGYTADEEIQKLLHSGTVEFLEKPFLLADLAETLARLTGAR
jgi:PAS domain S-box-containing protein